MFGWHHQFFVHEFEQALEVGDGQGRLVCCNPWGGKKSEMTEILNCADRFSKVKITLSAHDAISKINSLEAL